MEQKLADLKIQDEADENGDINILLLGETGVGKSTFINAIANYLHHQDFDKAITDSPFHLIESKFHVIDDNGESHEVCVGENKEDKNECLDVGAAATQGVKTYIFTIFDEKTKIRLIDTPGMLDPRGVEQDDKNCESILSYLSNIEKLHAICFLFKPNDARITYTFEYCLKQILSRLDKSAARNIVFIFTNTKGTNYRPGETFTCLKKVIRDIEIVQNVKIETKKNVFCFDNEAFRFLAAIKQGLYFTADSKEEFVKSWNKSREESWRLIRYLVGDAGTPPLKPHMVKSTVSVNEARSLINKLGQPLADITQLIADNLAMLHRRKKELKEKNWTLSELNQKLHVPIINIRAIKVNQPITVCKDLKCAERLVIDGASTWNYKQKCHEPCYLTNVPQDIVGAPQLRDCAAMDSDTQICKLCGCPAAIHLHVYYLTEKFDDTKIDSSVENKIQNEEKALAEVQRVILEIGAREKLLNREKGVIMRCAVRFANFLKNNAITPVNDALRKYLEMMIENAKYSDLQSSLHLQGLLKEYDEIQKVFDNASNVVASANLTPKDVNDCLLELYNLEIHGATIRELYESQESSRKSEFKTSEYVHSTIIIPRKNAKKLKNLKKNANKINVKQNGQNKNFKAKTYSNSKYVNQWQKTPNDQRGNKGNWRNNTRQNYIGNFTDQQNLQHNTSGPRHPSPPPPYDNLHSRPHPHNFPPPRDNRAPCNNIPPLMPQQGGPAPRNCPPNGNWAPNDYRPMYDQPPYDNRPRGYIPRHDNSSPYNNPPPHYQHPDSRYQGNRPAYNVHTPEGNLQSRDNLQHQINLPPQNNLSPQNYQSPQNSPPSQNYQSPQNSFPPQNYQPPQNSFPRQNNQPPQNSPLPQNYQSPQNSFPPQNYQPPQNSFPPQNYQPPQNSPPSQNYQSPQNIIPPQNTPAQNNPSRNNISTKQSLEDKCYLM